ncbi:MAG: TrmH family RNA methyltransferase [Melioribacteraceae bacterium]
MKTRKIILILHDIRSVENVGAIFRTADAIGVSKIIISGYTPAPIDRFGRERGDLKKTALGAEKTIPWEQVKNINTKIKNLKKEGFDIIALEQNPKSLDYKKYKPKEKTAVIVGSEVLGVSEKNLSLCDYILEIPMNGEKESLNVSVATGILLYRLFDN